MMAINLIPLKNDRSPQPSSDESQETASRTTQTRAGSRALEDGKDKTTQTVEEPTPIETDEKPTNTKQTRKKKIV